MLSMLLPQSDLFESLKNLLSLAEVSKQKLQCSRNKLWIIVHDEIQQNTKKQFAALSIQVKISTFRAKIEHKNLA